MSSIITFPLASLFAFFTLFLQLVTLPIVRAGGDPNGKNFPEGYLGQQEMTLCSSTTSSTDCTITPPLVISPSIVSVVTCCEPIETITQIPPEICNTIVMCGVDNAECNGERIRKIEQVVDNLIEDREKARVFVNNQMIVIGTAVEISTTSDVAQQDANAASSNKRIAGTLLTILSLVFVALVF